MHELSATTCATPSRSAMRAFELADERAVGEHAAVVRRLEPAHHSFERRAGRPGERQAGRERGVAAEQRRKVRGSTVDRCAAVGGPPVRAVVRSSSVGRSRPRSIACGARASVAADVGGRDVGVEVALDAVLGEHLVEQADDDLVRRAGAAAAPARRGSTSSRVGSVGTFGVRPRIDGCHVGSTISASSCRYSCRRSPGRVPTISILMSSSGRWPARRIIWRASSMIFTGWPMSSTNTLRLSAIAPAWSTRLTASGMVMK